MSIFTEEKYIKHLNKKVKTPFGYQTIEYIYKTIPLKCIFIKTEHHSIEVAMYHTFVVNRQEIAACNLIVGDYLETIDGLEKIIDISLTEEKVLYDISLYQEIENQWYYSNGILSHNSGKSITVACYLAWLFTFFRERNIGIVANRAAQAKEFLRNTKDIYTRLPMWLAVGITEWNKSSVANENEMRILTDVPSGDSFRGFTCHCLVIDECAFIDAERWAEFADSIFPSQGALSWKKNIIISTAKGLNHFHDIVQRAKISTIKNKENPEEHDGTVLVEVDWREVPRYASDGSLIDPEVFKAKIINKHGRAYFEQNYGNNFTGSAETLVDTDILDSWIHQQPIEMWGPEKIRLNVFELPIEGHTYLMGVDAAKDGEDNFAVQILDITEFPFRQVASAELQVNYLEMPEYIYEWGLEFNTAHIIIENNEGAGQSVADSLMNVYEYPNLYYDKGKQYPGFRTNKATRQQILKLMQVLLNAKKISIVDNSTISDFRRFEKINGKYQAADGHDDLIMALAICMAVLNDADNFEDYREFLQSLRSDEVIDTKSFLTDLSYMSFSDY